MCADFKQILNVWRIDCRPSRYFTRRVGVCIVGVSTSHADKFRLAFTVALIDLSTLRAGSRSVAWIDKFNRDTSSLCLVQNKALQLVEGPTVQTAALFFTSPYPDSNTAQILQSDPASGALCSTNYLLRNYVVRIGSETPLFPLSASHQPLSAFGALILKFAPKSHVARPVIVDRRAREPLAVRCVGNSHEAKVNTNPFESLILFLVRNVNGRKQKPFFVPVNQISLATLKRQQLPVVVAANERDLLPTGQCPNAGKTLVHVPRQDAKVVRDRAVFSKLAANLAIEFIGIGNLCIQADHYLCRQGELIPDLSVKPLMQRILTKLLRFPRESTQPIARRISSLKRTQESIRLLWRWLKFDLSGQLDTYLNTSSLETMQLKKERHSSLG